MAEGAEGWHATAVEKREFHGRRCIGWNYESYGCTIRSLRLDREIEPGIVMCRKDGRPNYKAFQPSELRSTMRNDRQDRRGEESRR